MRRGYLGTAAIIAGLLCLALTPASASARLLAFWANSNADVISYAPLLGEGQGADLPMNPGFAHSPFGLAIDAATGKIYWLNASGSIVVAKISGGSARFLRTPGATFASPAGLAIDPSGGRLYWANEESGTIEYANLDGSGGGQLLSLPSGSQPSGVAVDPAAGRIYWSNFSADAISSANLSGGEVRNLDTSGAPVDGPEGVAIDHTTGRVYWTNWNGNSIGYAGIAGGNGGEAHLNMNMQQPVGIAIEPLSQTVFWGDEGSNAIRNANLAGCCTIGLEIGSATQDGVAFPVLLHSPMMAQFPSVQGARKPGSTLTCSPGQWDGDVVESFYYRAPQSFAYQWLRNSKPIPAANAPTVVAEKVGTYTCDVTASNFAGSDTEPSSPEFKVNATVGFKRVSFNRRKGTAILRVAVTGSGKIALFGNGVANVSRKQASGTVKLVVRTSGKARIKLNETGKAKVKATVAYTPEGGKAIRRGKAIVLKKKLRD